MLKDDPSQLDYFQLVKAAKRLDTSGCTRSIRLALLGDCATQQLSTLLRVLFQRNGVAVDLHEAEYDTIELEAFNPTSALHTFKADYVVLLNSSQKLSERYYDHGEVKDGFVDASADRLAAVWDAVERGGARYIVQSTYVVPTERVFGNYDNKVPQSLYGAVQGVNAAVRERSRERKNLLLNDVDYLASYVGKRHWCDDKLWTLAKYPCALEHLPLLAQNIVDVVLASLGSVVKCVVMDLDNTMWGGVIGDDGLDGIRVGHLGEGEAFHSFQLYLRELKRRGVLLAVCSKNDKENALRPFRDHPDMVLREDDFAVFVANWDNKVDNLRAIQSILNIDFSSMVFCDDNPFERSIVRRFLPTMIVPELPEDPAGYVKALTELNLFETTTHSAADAQRTDQYRDQARRDVERLSFANVSEYLQSLEMKITLGRFDAFSLPRIAQLIQRSNQFNLTTRRYSEPECQAFMEDVEGSVPLWVSLKDKFGDLGLVLVAICRVSPDELEIDSFLMSCRVLQRGVEQHAMNTIFAAAQRRGVRRVVGRYIPTAKNSMVKDFYRGFGFKSRGEDAHGASTWELAVDDYVPAVVHMEAIEPPNNNTRV
jgi:FkbH-like protein